MKAAIITDAWHPQTNGVVKTLATTAQKLRAAGHDVCVIGPNRFRTFACPTYPEIRLAWRPYRRIDELLRRFAADAIHIATEGTLGAAARSWCLRQRMPFTTSYHTQFPEYVRACADSTGSHVRLPAPFSRRRCSHDGGDTDAATPA